METRTNKIATWEIKKDPYLNKWIIWVIHPNYKKDIFIDYDESQIKIVPSKEHHFATKREAHLYIVRCIQFNKDTYFKYEHKQYHIYKEVK